MKSKIFLDTNIILDLLGERIPFYEPIAKIVSLADMGKIELVVSALSFTNVNCILSKSLGKELSKDKLRKFKILTKTVSLDDVIIEKGLNSKFNDFEDSLQYHSAVKYGCSIIITRNIKDFKESLLPVMTAEEYLISIGKK
jgi:predicted nucleic acid-binding protein